MVLDLWIWRASHKAVNNFDTKLRPWSENIWNGQSNLEKKLSTAAFAVTSAVYDGSGTHSTHFVN